MGAGGEDGRARREAGHLARRPFFPFPHHPFAGAEGDLGKEVARVGVQLALEVVSFPRRESNSVRRRGATGAGPRRQERRQSEATNPFPRLHHLLCESEWAEDGRAEAGLSNVRVLPGERRREWEATEAMSTAYCSFTQGKCALVGCDQVPLASVLRSEPASLFPKAEERGRPGKQG